MRMPRRSIKLVNYFDAVNSDNYYNLIEGLEKIINIKTWHKMKESRINKKKRKMGLYKEKFERWDNGWEIINSKRREGAEFILMVEEYQIQK